MTAIYKGDNTAAFGNNFINITVNNPQLYKILKILFVINNGCIVKEFTNNNYFQTEKITLTANLTSQETEKLLDKNIGKIVLYDINNQQLTCNETLTFGAKNGVIQNVRCNCGI